MLLLPSRHCYLEKKENEDTCQNLKNTKFLEPILSIAENIRFFQIKC